MYKKENKKHTLLEFISVHGIDLSWIGLLVYSFSQTRTTFYAFMLLLLITFLSLILKLFIYYKQKSLIKGALSGFEWVCLAVSLTSFCVGLLTPAGVLYN